MHVTYYSIRLLLIVALFHDYKWISSSAYRFALVPKIQDNPFFDVSREGCQDKANELGHECVYVGPREEDPDGTLQLEILKKLIRNTTHKIDGIAVSVRSADNQELTAVIQEAVQERGIPFVTFDSDAAPNTLRSAYIGTDNFFFGTQLAKVLEQIHPTGNKYYAIASQSDPNIREREEGLRAQLAEFGWTEVPTSPSDMMGNVSLAMDQMREFAAEYPQLAAIVPVRGGPMRSGQWKQFVMEHRHLRLVVADALPNQLEFLSRDYCHGLVGQLPYEMGARSLTALVELVENNGSFRSIVNTPKKALNGAIIDMNGAATIPDDDDDGSSTPSTHFIGTNVLEHLQIPLVLPELTVKLNQIAELKYVGYTFFGTIAAISIYFAVWTWRRRNNRVVKVAQPEFLILIAFGILIMGAAIIPLSFDDASEDANLVAACMSIPWLISVGFTITFSGLCAKLWRVTAIFNNKNQFQRTAGKTNLQALMPFALLLTANVVVLICWSILDPSTYTRRPHDGLDGWGRIISTYGACQSGNPFYFIAPLGIINVVVLIAANTIAYRTRMIKSEFSESKYIGIAVGSMLQACLVGVPVLLIVQQEPRAYYVVLILLLFIVCLAILLLVFVPKIALYSLYKAETHSQQRLKMSNSIAVSSKRASAFHSKEMNDYSLQKADEQQRSRDRCNNHSRSAAESKETNGKMDDFSSSGYTHKVLDFSSSAGQGQERHEDANHNSFGSLEASSGDHHKQLQQQIEQAPSSSRRYPMRYDFDEEPVRISARRVSDQSTGHPAKYTDHGLESMETTQNSDA